MAINRITQAADIIKADNLAVQPSSAPLASLSSYEPLSTSLPSSIPGDSDSAASTVQTLPSVSLLGDGISLVSSGSQLFSSAMPSATMTPYLQGSSSTSPNTLPPSFLSVFAPVLTVSESLLPTYSSTAEASPFSNTMTDFSSVSSSERSTTPKLTQVVTAHVVTVTNTETATTVGGTDMSGVGSAGLGSSSLVLPPAVASVLSSLVLADSTSGEIEVLKFSPSDP